ncbi:MAG: hypothetical protein IT368_10050 [Candidatus Hydrogenedentes bacterium]|nr:hypothetical protein [Candidatus Hydrogenedentota bacterium]
MLYVRMLVREHVRLWRPLIMTFGFAASVAAGLFLTWFATDMDLGDLTRDPLSVAELRFIQIDQVRAALGGRVQHPEAAPPLAAPAMEAFDAIDLLVQPYHGLVSNLGVLLWTTAMSVALFTAALVRRRQPAEAAFFTAGGVLSLLLMIDDFFLVHERVLPIYFGLDEKVLFVLYGLLLLAWIALWHRRIFASDWLLLGYGLGFFALSLGVDIVPVNLPQIHFFEDGFKFTGICGWTAWHLRTASQALQR